MALLSQTLMMPVRSTDGESELLDPLRAAVSKSAASPSERMSRPRSSRTKSLSGTELESKRSALCVGRWFGHQRSPGLC